MKISGVTQFTYFAKGSRGLVYTGMFKGKKVGIKVRNPESTASLTLAKEAAILQRVNKIGIGNKFVRLGKNYVMYEFSEGVHMLDFVKKATDAQKKKVFKNLFLQCYKMDKLGLNKEEMLRPYTNVIIAKGNIPVLIDFERAHFSESPKNVTQFTSYVIAKSEFSDTKRKRLYMLSAEYKNNPSKKLFDKLVKQSLN